MSELQRSFVEVLEGRIIALDRVVDVRFTPHGLMHEVGENRSYDYDIAEEWSRDALDEGKDFEIRTVEVPIITISFINVDNRSDYVRRNGRAAEKLWDFFYVHLTAFALGF
jgi:hypothetical protein